MVSNHETSNAAPDCRVCDGMGLILRIVPPCCSGEFCCCRGLPQEEAEDCPACRSDRAAAIAAEEADDLPEAA